MLPQRFLPQHGTDAATWAVTARRSDGPTQPKNNAGERHFVLPAAYMMMAFYTDREVATDRWASYIGVPNSVGFCKRWPARVKPFPGVPRLLLPASPYPWGGALFIPSHLSFFALTAHGLSWSSLAWNAQGGRCFLDLSRSLSTRRIHPHLQHFHFAVRPSGLPTGSKTDTSFEALVSPEHHALALTGSRPASWHQH